MRIVRDFAVCPPECKGAVIALGNFDGVHLGHQSILRSCMDTAHAAGIKAAVMTFEPHPREFFGRSHERLRIASFRRKAELLRDAGIDILFVVRFNERFSSLAAEAFVQEVLHRQLAVKHVVTGYNFAFGKGRSGTTDFLMKQGRSLEFGFTACSPVHEVGGKVVSSSAIRQLLAVGDVRKAAQWLGRPYDIEGKVQKGQQRGRTIGFPTANISLTHLFKPRFGVYAVRISAGGTWYDAVANLGVRPTFDQHEALLEVHGFDMNQSLYGQQVRVEFVDFIRDEKRFDNVEALRTQIVADCAQAREVLGGC